ncbi:MAG TPA: hypothetical protein VF015_01560 [Acidimicrobiales bacterium]
MIVTSKRRMWLVIGGAIVAAVVAVVLFLVATDDDEGDLATDATTSTSDADGEQSTTSDTTAGTTSTSAAPATGFATPQAAAADRYGSSYLGACESVPMGGDWSEDAVCSVEVSLSNSEVVLLVGPPYSEVLEDLLVRLDGGTWTVVDTYAVGEPGVEDPNMPDWVRTALEIKDREAA